MQSKEKTMNLLLAFTGSVASIKYLDMINCLKAAVKDVKLEIRIVLTQRAQQFLDQNQIPNDIKVYSDQDEWDSWKKKGDQVLHIDLREWADLLLIAPLSANTMAKITNGLCDNLLTCIVRAWDYQKVVEEYAYISENVSLCQVRLLKKPIIVAPAMNTQMYLVKYYNKIFNFKNPITSKQMSELTNMNYIILNPINKLLACGEQGLGAMQEPQVIAKTVKQVLKQLNYNEQTNE